jgi:hypothetical protein
VGALAAPTAAPTVGAALTGTGPDQGSHDYAVSFVTSYGETIPGPISNSQTTSAAVGQLPEPAAPSGGSALQGSGVPNGQHQYRATFVNAAGETTVSNAGPPLTAETRLVGKTDPVVDQSWGGSTQGTTGGNVAPGPYAIYYTHVTAQGETNAVGSGIHCTLTAPNNAIQVPLPQHSDPRVTGHKLYRLFGSGSAAGAHLCATITHNNGGTYIDKAANETIQNNPTPPATNTTGNPGTPTPFNILQVTGVPIGPAGTTARRLYRGTGSGDAGKLVGTISNNSQTTFNDSLATPGAAAPTSNTTGTALQRLPLSNLPIGQAGVTARKLWRRFNGAGAFRLVTTIADNGTTDYTDAVGNSALGANAPATTTAVGNQIAASAIPIGPAPTTQRELYMQPLAGGAFRLALTIPNNTATTGTITVSDATLNGAPAAPAADTSGLTQPQGQVNPGATAIPLAAAATFRPSGGWVNIAGDQVVRYTGITGQSLTGIPATGPGAITTTVLYGSQALPAPMLVGVVGLTKALKKGAAIHLWIQRDDLAAQAEHAARTGGDGVVEYLITDTRRTIDSLTARCDADLALFSRPIVTVGYTTRDVKTKSGKPVRVTLPGFTVGEELTIQDVTITQIDVARGTAPRFAVQASNVRFSLEDTLRRLIAAENKGLR